MGVEQISLFDTSDTRYLLEDNAPGIGAVYDEATLGLAARL